MAGTPSNDLNISQAGYVVFDGVATFTGRTFQAGAGITITNASGVAGNTTISLTGGGSAIQTINGDSGTISGNNVTIFANKATLNSGSTVSFVNAATTSTFNVTDANFNTIIGKGAGNASDILTAANTVVLGSNAYAASKAAALAIGGDVSIGYASMSLFTGDPGAPSGNNVAVGQNALLNLLTGKLNIAIGNSAGSNYTAGEQGNIVIGNLGTAAENSTIRIGTSQTKCFIQGIASVSVSNLNLVTIDTSTKQLGSITPTGNVFTWTDVTGATQTIAINNGYITDRGAGVTYTLPATASLGDVIKIVGKLGITTITPNANQQILISSASGTVGVTGTAVGTNVGDCIELRCITSGASTVWRADNFVGNWTLN